MLIAQDAAGLICLLALGFMGLAVVVAVFQALRGLSSPSRLDRRDMEDLLRQMDERNQSRDKQERRRCRP